MRRSPLLFYLPLLVLSLGIYTFIYLGIQSVNSFSQHYAVSSVLSTTGSTIPTEEQPIFLVTRVIDGDTIEVQTELGRKKVRLIGIDTPETYGEPECFGKEATAYAEELLFQAQVRLDSDVTQDNTDRYGRLLRYVYTEEDGLINSRMIEGGFAKEYTYQKPYLLQTMFQEAEKEAKRFQRGMWGYCSSPHTV